MRKVHSPNKFIYNLLGRIWKMLYFKKLNPFSKVKSAQENRDTLRLWGKVLVASIPAAIAGFLIDDWMNSLFARNVKVEVAVIAVKGAAV